MSHSKNFRRSPLEMAAFFLVRLFYYMGVFVLATNHMALHKGKAFHGDFLDSKLEKSQFNLYFTLLKYYKYL